MSDRTVAPTAANPQGWSSASTPEELTRNAVWYAQLKAQEAKKGNFWWNAVKAAAPYFIGAQGVSSLAATAGVGAAGAGAGAAGAAGTGAVGASAGSGAVMAGGSKMSPALIQAITAGAQHVLGAVAAKKQANSAQSLEEQKYNDQVATYYAEAQKAEDDRLQKLSLVTSFAKANGLDSALTPEVLASLSKRREPAPPPPYRKGGTPGFGWDLAANAIGDAGAIYGAAKAPKPAAPRLPFMGAPTGASPNPSFGSTNSFFQRPVFSNPPGF